MVEDCSPLPKRAERQCHKSHSHLQPDQINIYRGVVLGVVSLIRGVVIKYAVMENLEG